MKRRIRRTHVALATGVSLALFGGALQLTSWNSSAPPNTISASTATLTPPTGLTGSSGTASWNPLSIPTANGTVSPSYNLQGYGHSGWSTLGSGLTGTSLTPSNPDVYACYGVQTQVGNWTSPYSTAAPSGASKGYPTGQMSDPRAIAIASNGDAYVVNFHQAGNNSANGSVSVIDTATNTYITTITSYGFDGPYAIAIASNGDAYVTNSNGNSISVISTTNNTYVTTITGFDGPNAIAFGTNGDAYVTNSTNSTVSVVDTSTNAIIATISGFDGPNAVAIAANGDAYVTNNGNHSVSVISTTTNLGTFALSAVATVNRATFIPGTNFGYALSNTHLSPIGPCY